MPPRKKRVLQEKEGSDGPPLAAVLHVVKEPGVVRLEAQETPSAEPLPNTGSTGRQAADRGDAPEQRLRRRTYNVRPAAASGFNRRETYVISGPAALDDDSGPERAAAQHGDGSFFVGQAEDWPKGIQAEPLAGVQDPPKAAENNIIEKKVRGRAKKPQTASNPEDDDLKSPPEEQPKKRGRKQKAGVIVSALPVVTNTSPTVADPVLMDSIEEKESLNDMFSATDKEKTVSNPDPENEDPKSPPEEQPKKRGRKQKAGVIVSALPVVINASATVTEHVLMDDVFCPTDEEKTVSNPEEDPKSPPEEQPKKRGRKQKAGVIVSAVPVVINTSPTVDDPALMDSIEEKESMDDLFCPTDEEKEPDPEPDKTVKTKQKQKVNKKTETAEPKKRGGRPKKPLDFIAVPEVHEEGEGAAANQEKPKKGRKKKEQASEEPLETAEKKPLKGKK
ncbi:neurofilament heavy polypeptide-like [Ambystoma mexicanum]|uniref:neurofilament heavy polypeptide-like n=1 Tax=Ambystoma mexicanum TaxID=8296 RepID=UPI0037E7B05C